MEVNKNENEVILCNCGDTDHHVIFQWFPDEKEVYITVRLTKHPSFWKRLKSGIRFIFNRQNSIKSWTHDAVITNVSEIETVINKIKESQNGETNTNGDTRIEM